MVFVLYSLILSGCYYFSATREMKAAEQSFAELKAAGGATLVPYEYTSAKKYLEISKITPVQIRFLKTLYFGQHET